jgi:quinol monooxygenase YgiN
MSNTGMFVRLRAKPGKDRDVEEFLRSALALAEKEQGTVTWFAIRFGRGEYGIFDSFADDQARLAHLDGAMARALQDRADELFEAPLRMQQLAILADKLPTEPMAASTKGVLLKFRAKAGRELQVEQFLRNARALVMKEQNTTAWFAIRTDDGEYGIFDVFPDGGGRFAHLIGHVPRELAKQALSLLGSVPSLEMLNVQSEKLGSSVAGYATRH